MSKPGTLGPWVKRFLIEYLLMKRNLSRNTQRTYRDTLATLIRYAAKATGKRPDLLDLEDMGREIITKCFAHGEFGSGRTARTSNRHLAALRSFARFVGEYGPENLPWAAQVFSISFKRYARPQIPYLEKVEMDALLAAPDTDTRQGKRDYNMLLFLYNTGARASEAAQLKISDLQMHGARGENSFVTLQGKGGKARLCPLWPHAALQLTKLIGGRQNDQFVFLNRRSEPLTRFGIHALVERYTRQVAKQLPALNSKRVSPHTIRHTTATHLLRAGVDINTIRAWLGHVSLTTTNMYADIDLEAKSRALAHLEPAGGVSPARQARGDLMQFLSAL
jgi:integrase/recombinase XerD